jgi:hypothetical protein
MNAFAGRNVHTHEQVRTRTNEHEQVRTRTCTNTNMYEHEHGHVWYEHVRASPLAPEAVVYDVQFVCSISDPAVFRTSLFSALL